jgi:nitrite reductase/ring-hydroxylating ferredoxin subunit
VTNQSGESTCNLGRPGIAAPAPAAGNFHGYDIDLATEADPELTAVGPKTPAGEYLRRYWQPVYLTSELGKRPQKLRRFGEDLVLFRDGEGRLGLVHQRCPHRQASLEFGTCFDRGIRCCYHGWHFDIDGTLLEAPGQGSAANERLRTRVQLGAYPVIEFKGLIFAYLGPADEMPEFPVYDTLMFEDMEMVPYKAPFACNWLQVLDAILDPIHTSFLHSRMSRVQFSEGFGAIGRLDFFDRGQCLLGTNTRRVDNNLWFRVNELVLPNFTQAGAAFAADGTARHLYGRSAFNRWVIPLDDTETLAIAWASFGERGDPLEFNTAQGPELIEQGEVFDRSDEEKQKFPGDAEACEGMGLVNIHANEHLAPSDKGVAMMRRRLREGIRAVAKGEPAPRLATNARPIPTYGGDTVIAVPALGDADESVLQGAAEQFMALQFAADDLPEPERIRVVTERLVELEARLQAP